MLTSIPHTLALLFLTTPGFMLQTQPAPTSSPAANPADTTAADALARAVASAAGADSWHKVSRIRFTFNVFNNDNSLLSAKHDWNLKSNTLQVQWADKNVNLDLTRPPATDDEKAAFARWTNDTYWLLAPLKLFDGGTIRTLQADQTVDGKTYRVLRLSFQSVGLTPGDQYDLLIDPQTNRLAFWDYMPKPDVSRRFTWEAHTPAGPLVLSTDHRAGPLRITITDLQVD